MAEDLALPVTLNQRVAGSSPAAPTMISKAYEPRPRRLPSSYEPVFQVSWLKVRGFVPRKRTILGQVSASPSDTRGRSRVPELGSLGSVRGALSNGRPYC